MHDRRGGGGETDLYQVVSGTAPVHYQEVALAVEGDYRVVPHAARVVDALAAVGHEGAQLAGVGQGPGGAATIRNGVGSSGMNACDPSG